MPESPFNGRYLIRNPKARMAISLIDKLLGLWCINAKRHFHITPPKKLLICNLASIGDVVLTSSLLPVVRDALPNCEIGMLVGSWGAPLLEGVVDHLHIYDHWKITGKRFKGDIIAELKEAAYDISLDCCFYYPNSHTITYKAKIPVRIGYNSAGFGPLLTHPVQYTSKRQSVTEHIASLLALITPIDRNKLKPTLNVSATRDDYIVIHMGTSIEQKEWPLENWRELAEKLNHRLIFTGIGDKERANIKVVTQGLDHCMSLADHLSLREFASLIGGAKLLVSVDTGAGHIAAATETPSVLVYSGIHHIELWRPKSPLAQVMVHQPKCYPCYQTKGCNTMECIKKVTVDQVLKKVNATLGQS